MMRASCCRKPVPPPMALSGMTVSSEKPLPSSRPGTSPRRRALPQRRQAPWRAPWRPRRRPTAGAWRLTSLRRPTRTRVTQSARRPCTSGCWPGARAPSSTARGISAWLSSSSTRARSTEPWKTRRGSSGTCGQTTGTRCLRSLACLPWARKWRPRRPLLSGHWRCGPDTDRRSRSAVAWSWWPRPSPTTWRTQSSRPRAAERCGSSAAATA
mmetsp:Transcript_130788/g.364498  ORF Transcript_130788/g.364498 Transcript_130788/m.364498 type:complete len:212 (-) Transcript_130788:1297-1932(-)